LSGVGNGVHFPASSAFTFDKLALGRKHRYQNKSVSRRLKLHKTMMWSSVTRNALLLAFTASPITSFLQRAVKSSPRVFVPRSSFHVATFQGSASGLLASKDTPAILPDFDSKDDYLKYVETVSGLPAGFATGTASGTFISEEAPALGKLPIRATVIHLTAGATDNWAAVFTQNRVRLRSRNSLAYSMTLFTITIFFSSQVPQ